MTQEQPHVFTPPRERFGDLYQTFCRLVESRYEGVPGVMRIDGARPGPTVGITVCTHGNEPAGLAAARYLMEEIAPERDLLAGTIYLVLNNVEATEQYFNARSSEDARKARFTDVNMNRLPIDALMDESDARYELRRTRELMEIYQQFDVGLDIHSTTQDTTPMIIALGGSPPTELIRGMPIPTIISNIDAVQVGKPVSHYYGGPEARKFGIEAGTHEKPESFANAVKCTEALLQNLTMIDGERSEEVVAEYHDYVVTQSIIFPDHSYELVRLFKDYEFIPAGTVLAHGDGPDIVAKIDCHSLFAARTRPDSLDEEVMFLTEPVQTKKIP